MGNGLFTQLNFGSKSVWEQKFETTANKKLNLDSPSSCRSEQTQTKFSIYQAALKVQGHPNTRKSKTNSKRQISMHQFSDQFASN